MAAVVGGSALVGRVVNLSSVLLGAVVGAELLIVEMKTLKEVVGKFRRCQPVAHLIHAYIVK